MNEFALSKKKKRKENVSHEAADCVHCGIVTYHEHVTGD